MKRTKPSDDIEEPAIARLVKKAGGPAALSNALGGKPVYQEIQRWVRRGYCSHIHVFRLKPFLPRGMKLEDLGADRERAKAQA